jgi:hypothetical protein
MDNDTQVLDPVVLEPAATETLDPVVMEPAATETIDPVVEEPLDPITGTESGSPSNTSNGNQVAVNSNFDYSVHNLTVYSYTSTQTNESLTTQMSQASGELREGNEFNCGTVNGRLGRSYRFDSRDYFRSKRRNRVDRITNFSSESGDTLELARRVFKGIGDLDFVSVANRKKAKKAARTDSDIIYERSSGRLYFNANDDDKRFGAQGGLFAVLESSPLISSSDFILI